MTAALHDCTDHGSVVASDVWKVYIQPIESGNVPDHVAPALPDPSNVEKLSERFSSEGANGRGTLIPDRTEALVKDILIPCLSESTWDCVNFLWSGIRPCPGYLLCGDHGVSAGMLKGPIFSVLEHLSRVEAMNTVAQASSSSSPLAPGSSPPSFRVRVAFLASLNMSEVKGGTKEREWIDLLQNISQATVSTIPIEMDLWEPSSTQRWRINGRSGPYGPFCTYLYANRLAELDRLFMRVLCSASFQRCQENLSLAVHIQCLRANRTGGNATTCSLRFVELHPDALQEVCDVLMYNASPGCPVVCAALQRGERSHVVVRYPNEKRQVRNFALWEAVAAIGTLPNTMHTESVLESGSKCPSTEKAADSLGCVGGSSNSEHQNADKVEENTTRTRYSGTRHSDVLQTNASGYSSRDNTNTNKVLLRLAMATAQESPLNVPREGWSLMSYRAELVKWRKDVASLSVKTKEQDRFIRQLQRDLWEAQDTAKLTREERDALDNDAQSFLARCRDLEGECERATALSARLERQVELMERQRKEEREELEAQRRELYELREEKMLFRSVHEELERRRFQQKEMGVEYERQLTHLEETYRAQRNVMALEFEESRKHMEGILREQLRMKEVELEQLRKEFDTREQALHAEREQWLQRVEDLTKTLDEFKNQSIAVEASRSRLAAQAKAAHVTENAWSTRIHTLEEELFETQRASEQARVRYLELQGQYVTLKEDYTAVRDRLHNACDKIRSEAEAERGRILEELDSTQRILRMCTSNHALEGFHTQEAHVRRSLYVQWLEGLLHLAMMEPQSARRVRKWPQVSRIEAFSILEEPVQIESGTPPPPVPKGSRPCVTPVPAMNLVRCDVKTSTVVQEEAYRAEISELNAILRRVTEDCERATLLHRRAQDTVQVLQEDLNRTRAELSECRSAVQTLLNEKGCLERQLTAERDRHGNEMSQLRIELSESLQHQGKREQELLELQRRVMDYEKQEGEHTHELKYLREKLASKAAWRDVQVSKTRAVREMAEKDALIATLQDRITRLTTRLAVVKRDHEKQRQQEVERVQESYQNRLSDAKEEIHQLQSQVQELIQHYHAYQKERRAARERMQDGAPAMGSNRKNSATSGGIEDRRPPSITSIPRDLFQGKKVVVPPQPSHQQIRRYLSEAALRAADANVMGPRTIKATTHGVEEKKVPIRASEARGSPILKDDATLYNDHASSVDAHENDRHNGWSSLARQDNSNLGNGAAQSLCTPVASLPPPCNRSSNLPQTIYAARDRLEHARRVLENALATEAVL